MYFAGLWGRIEAPPEMEKENPFTISASSKVNGDYVELRFVGYYAQAERKRILSLRTGDIVVLSGRLNKDTLLVQDIKLMENDFVGRNLNKYM